VATLFWAPGIMRVAAALRPSLLSSPRYQPGTQAAINAARGQMWAVVLLSLLAVVALAVASLLVGRRTLPATVSASARQATWAVGCLAGGLVVAAAPFLFEQVSRSLYLPLYSNLLLIPFAMAGAVASFILSGLALRPAETTYVATAGSRPAWHIGARVCVVVAPLVALAVAATVALAAQFVVGFYLHLVF
jgi:hypothetical protein